MGSLYKDTCEASAADAAAAMCGSEWPKSIFDASGTKVQSCIVLDPATLQLATFDAAASSTATTTVPVSFASCDPLLQYTDSLEMWGLGILLCMLIWAARAAVKPVTGDY